MSVNVLETPDEVVVSAKGGDVPAGRLVPRTTPGGLEQVVQATLDRLQYPDPSPEWQREVTLLQEQVQEQKRKDEEAMELAELREDQITRELRHIEEGHRTSASSIRQQAQESRLQVHRAHLVAATKDTNRLLQLSNDKCNTLSRLFEMRVQAMEKKMATQRSNEDAQRRIRALEARCQQLEEDNHQLRMRYSHEDDDRALREQELKKLAIEQAKEIEELSNLRNRTTREDKDFSHLGLEIGDSMTILHGGTLRSEAHSGVKVKRVTGAAADAGVCTGDLIMWATTSQRVTDVADFTNAVSKVRLGDNVSLVVRRGGQQKTVDLEVGRRSSPKRGDTHFSRR